MNEIALKKWLAPVVVVIFFLTACSSLKPAQIDPATGNFAAVEPVSKRDIKINKPLAGVSTVNFVYLRIITDRNPKKLDLFIRDSLDKIGFPKPVSEAELTQLIVKNGLASEIQSTTNVLALHRLSEFTGPFLVAEFRLFHLGGSWFQMDAVLVDPVSAQTVFSASRRKIYWLDFDREFSYPMMSAIREWFDESAKLPVPDTPTAKPRLVI